MLQHVCLSVFDCVAQQPQLSSIRRDRDELQKKIEKLQKQRDQCVRAQRLSEVCADSNPLYSTAFSQITVLLSQPYKVPIHDYI